MLLYINNRLKIVSLNKFLLHGGVVMGKKIEFLTIKVQYGYCSKCGEPVKLRRAYPASGEHYWKIIGHFGCSMNGKAGKPAIGAKETLFKKHCLINEKAGFGRRKKKILPYEEGFQSDLFQTPVAL